MHGDLSRLKCKVDAVVTSSNSMLAGNANASYWRFSGRRNVDGALRELQSFAEVQTPLAPGEAVLTPATGALLSTARFVIHVNAPEGAYASDASLEERKSQLRACYSNSLRLAKGGRSIAFPAIGCGVREWKPPVAAEAALDALAAQPRVDLDLVLIVCLDHRVLAAFNSVFTKRLGQAQQQPGEWAWSLP